MEIRKKNTHKIPEFLIELSNLLKRQHQSKRELLLPSFGGKLSRFREIHSKFNLISISRTSSHLIKAKVTGKTDNTVVILKMITIPTGIYEATSMFPGLGEVFSHN